MVQEEMSFKDTFIQVSCGPSVLCNKNHLCNLSREHYEEYFCEIILNWTSGSEGGSV